MLAMVAKEFGGRFPLMHQARVILLTGNVADVRGECNRMYIVIVGFRGSYHGESTSMFCFFSAFFSFFSWVFFQFV